MRRPTPRLLRRVQDATPPEFTPGTEVVTLRDRMDYGTFTAVGWVPPSHITHAGLRRVADTILAIERVTPWAWGDWYINGGNALVSDSGYRGPNQHSLETYASVAKRFPISRRLEHVPFSHHAEVAALPEAKRDALLNWCATERPSLQALRAEKARRLAPPRPNPPPPPPPPAPLPTPAPPVITADTFEPVEADETHEATASADQAAFVTEEMRQFAIAAVSDNAKRDGVEIVDTTMYHLRPDYATHFAHLSDAQRLWMTIKSVAWALNIAIDDFAAFEGRAAAIRLANEAIEDVRRRMLNDEEEAE